MRVLCASVLAFEAVVVALAIPVAITTQDVSGVAAGVGGGALALACLALAGLLSHRWAFVAGSVVQVLAISTGFVVPVMFLLGTVFAVLWVVALRLGWRYGGAGARAGTSPGTAAGTLPGTPPGGANGVAE